MREPMARPGRQGTQRSPPRRTTLAGLLSVLCMMGCVAAVAAAPAGRDTLTGDWNGQRDALAARGLEIELGSGATYQSLVRGGYRHADDVLGVTSLELRLDTARAGAWRGGGFRVRGEARYGHDIQAAFGGFNAVNVGQLFPHDPDRIGRAAVALTELVYTQTLTPRIQLFAGLLNNDEGDDNLLAGNLRRRNSFLNAALLSSPVRLATSPQAAPGIGLRLQATDRLRGEVRIHDSREHVGQRLFADGAGTTYASEWTYAYQLWGRPGRHLVGLRYADGGALSLAGSVDARLLAALAPALASARDHTWASYYNVSQSVADWGDGRGWGVFLRLGYGDNAANPIDWSTAFGAVVNGPFQARSHDAAGWGYFHVYQVDGPVMQAFALDDEQGWEAWYNLEMAPWLHVTADVQMIDSDIDRRRGPSATPVVMPGGLGASRDTRTDLIGRPPSDITWVLGLRTEIRF